MALVMFFGLLEWKRRTRRHGPLQITWRGWRPISAYLNLWIVKIKLFGRRRR